MTLTDREMARKFKEEADQLWFRDVHFDESLKRKVLGRIAEERAAGAAGRIRNRIRKAALGALSLAAAAALLLVVIPLVSPGQPPGAPAGVQVLSGAGGMESAAGGSGVPVDIFMEGDAAAPAPFVDGVHPVAPAAREGVSWTPLSAEEAAEAFGPGFALPGWVPEGFSLRQIGAFDEREGEAHSVTLTYMSEERAFWLTLRKAERPEVFPARETVDIHGAVGYLNAAPPEDRVRAEAGADGAPPAPPQDTGRGVSPDTGTDASSSGTAPGAVPARVAPAAPAGEIVPGIGPDGTPAAELYWFSGGIQYELHGAITGEEAVKIARFIPAAPPG